MILERKAPAKLNLGLHILEKRNDGFHNIETVFLHIPWYDTLRAEPAQEFRFSCSDDRLPLDDSNLCVKAANMMAAHGKQLPGVALHLEKHLPFGAGLGGGSSDAAHTLRLLNEYWQLNLPSTRLHEMAAQLGSDVPFFLEDSAMYATGRGEKLEPLLDAEGILPYTCPFKFVVVMPDVHVSTAEAYGSVKPHATERPNLKQLLASNDLAQWQKKLVNDFEVSVFKRFPAIAQVKKLLLNAGAGYAAMSGSGSAVFGVFEDEESASESASSIKKRGYQVWCESRER